MTDGADAVLRHGIAGYDAAEHVRKVIIWKLASRASAAGVGNQIAEHPQEFADAVSWIFESPPDGDGPLLQDVSTRISAVIDAFALIAVENYTIQAVMELQTAGLQVNVSEPSLMMSRALSIATEHLALMRREGRDIGTPPPSSPELNLDELGD